jgi:hypothetical protein
MKQRPTPVALTVVKRRSSFLLIAVAVVLLGAGILILVNGNPSGSSKPPACGRRIAPPDVPVSEQRKASQVALRMPFVRRLLANQPAGGVSVAPQGTRNGTLIGVQVLIRLGHPAKVDAIWPWLLIDNTDTLDPPYQLVRQHVRSNQVWAVTITVPAPSYNTGAVSNWVTAPGGSVERVPGTQDRRPPQPTCD